VKIEDGRRERLPAMAIAFTIEQSWGGMTDVS
jgi:hypothetical protein